MELITYNLDHFEQKTGIGIDEVPAGAADSVSWLNVEGLADSGLIEKIGGKFNLHFLMLEDVMNTEHRPKIDEYEDHLFFTLKMLLRIEEDTVAYEHISFVLGQNYLLSFQEKEGGDVFDQVRSRVKAENSIFRKRGADYLFYRLLDAIVDSYYEVLEKISAQVEAVEDTISQNPTLQDFRVIQELRKEFIYLRKVVHPLREALNKLMKNECGFLENRTIKYFGDVYDQVIHLIDALDTFRDVTTTLMDLYMNTINYRMNEVMKLLTVITTIFIPLSFIAGVYGMNFQFMPELTWRWGYFAVLGVMFAILSGMLLYFRHKKWF